MSKERKKPRRRTSFKNLLGRTRRQRLRSYYIFFSLLWVGAIAGFGIGYLREINAIGGHVSSTGAVNFTALLFGPLAVIWGPFLMTMDGQDNPRSEQRMRLVNNDEFVTNEQYHQQFDNLQNELSSIRASLSNIKTSQSEIQSTLPKLKKKTATIEARREAQKPAPTEEDDLASPALPLSGKKNGLEWLSLMDFAIVLHYSDFELQGDWANAFAAVREKSNYMDLVRMGEAIIEVLEQEGIYVEDLHHRPAPALAWRTLALGDRDDAIVEELATVQDPSVLALVRLRLRNDPEFQELSLRFQKRLIELIEAMEIHATEEEFEALGMSRAGRAFAILGHLSGTFKSRARA